MIYICYNEGYHEATAKEFPVLMDTLSRTNLNIKTDDNPKGQLTNERQVNKNFAGSKLTLAELFINDLNYNIIVQEINAGEKPVIWYKELNVMIQLRPETEIVLK